MLGLPFAQYFLRLAIAQEHEAWPLEKLRSELMAEDPDKKDPAHLNTTGDVILNTSLSDLYMDGAVPLSCPVSDVSGAPMAAPLGTPRPGGDVSWVTDENKRQCVAQLVTAPAIMEATRTAR